MFKEKTYEIIGWTHGADPRFSEITDPLKRAYLATTVIKEIREKKYTITGLDHLGNNGYVPVFNSGEKFCVSDRTWGGIMAQAFNEDNSDGEAYVSWLFFSPNGVKEHFPELKVDRSRMAEPGTVLHYEPPLDEEYYGIGPYSDRPMPDGNIVEPYSVSRKVANKRKKPWKT